MATNYLKPQEPLKKIDKDTGDINYLYPMTTPDQIVMEDGSRLNTNLIYYAEGSEDAQAYVNADTLGGILASEYATKEYINTSHLPTITQEAGESESLVMSQKAVTDLVSKALGTSGTTEYETVDSVEEMTDTSKSYMLSTTGTIWTYGETSVDVEPTNKFVASTATLNTRLGTSSESTALGMYSSDYIEFDGSTATSSIVWLPLSFNPTFGNQRIWFCDSSKALLVSKYIDINMTSSNSVKVAQDSVSGRYYIDMSVFTDNSANTYLANTKYVRLCLDVSSASTSITVFDIADVEILFENDRTTTIEMAWYDTGMKPSSTGGGGNYVDLLVKVNQNTSDISELNKRVTNVEADSKTVTVPTVWGSAVEDCIAKIKAHQTGVNCVTFPFFSDNHQRNGYAGMLIAHIMKECHIPFCFYGGDSISSGYIDSEATMIEQDKAFDTMMSVIPNGRFCRAVGNHDGYWAVSADERHYYTRPQVYELFLREEAIAQNKHFGADGTYYYIDDIASKVRFIVLNTNKAMVNNVATGKSVDDMQITWLQNTALSFSESGWAVVFISHQPISNHYHAQISNATEVISVVKNYINGNSTNKADIVGWFSGHIHRDRIWTGVATNTTDDSVGTAMGFTQVTITSDHTGIAYDDATKHTVAEDALSHAIDFVTINKDTKTVTISRLGIGNDRGYTY